MTKVRFHGLVARFSGAMGEMVFADQGKAVENGVHTVYWTYTATAPVPSVPASSLRRLVTITPGRKRRFPTAPESAM